MAKQLRNWRELQCWSLTLSNQFYMNPDLVKEGGGQLLAEVRLTSRRE